MKSKAIDRYFKVVTDLLNEVYIRERGSIEKAAKILADAIEEGRLIHIFGTGGHSYMGAEEFFYRAGGLIPVNPILDPGVSLAFGALRSTAIERLPGYAQKVMAFYDLKEGDPIIIVNAYGINSCTII